MTGKNIVNIIIAIYKEVPPYFDIKRSDKQ